MREFTFDYEEAVLVSKNMVNRLKNIQQDEGGYYFYGGTQNNDIECDENKSVIEDNEGRLRRTFKNFTNWHNMRKSKKPVGNHLRFIFCKLTNQKKYPNSVVRFGVHTCKKYYIPKCIMSDL
jgi:hypothetical protein|tara:strand:- start:1 stop:366 length:366 start_codon:yes stop_codon:yes gene_type:complete